MPFAFLLRRRRSWRLRPVPSAALARLVLRWLGLRLARVLSWKRSTWQRLRSVGCLLCRLRVLRACGSVLQNLVVEKASKSSSSSLALAAVPTVVRGSSPGSDSRGVDVSLAFSFVVPGGLPLSRFAGEGPPRDEKSRGLFFASSDCFLRRAAGSFFLADSFVFGDFDAEGPPAVARLVGRDVEGPSVTSPAGRLVESWHGSLTGPASSSTTLRVSSTRAQKVGPDFGSTVLASSSVGQSLARLVKRRGPRSTVCRQARPSFPWSPSTLDFRCGTGLELVAVGVEFKNASSSCHSSSSSWASSSASTLVVTLASSSVAAAAASASAASASAASSGSLSGARVPPSLDVPPSS